MIYIAKKVPDYSINVRIKALIRENILSVVTICMNSQSTSFGSGAGSTKIF